jgi:maleamate amidohydrolase
MGVAVCAARARPAGCGRALFAWRPGGAGAGAAPEAAAYNRAMTISLHDDYQRAGFGGALGFGRSPALLVIDVVQAYLLPNSPLYAAGFVEALASNERLVQAARDSGVPVLFTNVVYGAEGRDGGHFYRKVPALKCFLKGSPLGDFPPTLQPRADEVVVSKQYASAFFGTSLASTLRTMGVDTVLVTGFSTSGCVRATTLDALQIGRAHV